MTIAPGVILPESEIAAICRRYQVKELALFGSAARGECPDSGHRSTGRVFALRPR